MKPFFYFGRAVTCNTFNCSITGNFPKTLLRTINVCFVVLIDTLQHYSKCVINIIHIAYSIAVQTVYFVYI